MTSQICLFSLPGRNEKLGLSGRKSRDVGILSTSKLYSLQDRIFAFTPQVNDINIFINFKLLLTFHKVQLACHGSFIVEKHFEHYE